MTIRMPEPMPTVITLDTEWTSPSEGAVLVADGATLTIAGSHEGPIEIDGSSSTLLVTGSVTGPVTVESLASVIVSGVLTGPVMIRVAGTVTVEAGGRLVGAISNYGSLVNRGHRAGAVGGRTPDDEPGSTALAPAR
jgi:hypothetical protein